MQLCALDLNNGLVFAHQAIKHQDYTCLECRQRVRLRKGLQRQPHYYHSVPNQACRQSGKGMAHLLVQYFLREQIPVGESQLEFHFSSIGRIADVAWLTQKIVYEIQYSPISGDEVKQRNSDYASIGYQVIWVFFDGRYNQYKVTAAEAAVVESPHYFTNMDEEGNGTIYDQLAWIEQGVRKRYLPPFLVNLSRPLALDKLKEHSLKEPLPLLLLSRFKQWKMYFSGDSLENYFNKNDQTYLNAILEIELCRQSFQGVSCPLLVSALKSMMRRWVVIPYRAAFRLLLERCCR